MKIEFTKLEIAKKFGLIGIYDCAIPGDMVISVPEIDPVVRPVPSRVINSLNVGNKIQAIKDLREDWKCGLKEAKEFVESLSSLRSERPKDF